MSKPIKILFCARAYNDIDMQMSLIKTFAMDPRMKPEVMFYPCDGFITDHRIHELTQYFENTYGVRFSSALQTLALPFLLRVMYGLLSSVRQKRKSSNLLIFKVIDVGLARLISRYIDNLDYYAKIKKEINADIIITDEALFQDGRSAFLDYVVRVLAEEGKPVYCHLTGHRVYTALHPGGQKLDSKYKPSNARFFIVPSQHNKNIYEQLFPNENVVIGGNLRMDVDWISEMEKPIILPRVRLPDKAIKICIMLSKMNYGVEAEHLKETISLLGRMPNVALVLKPHTRGMKFDFMPKEDIGHAITADSIPSSALVNWCDLVLMTGSSIVFHAMVSGKVAGFLKYCQNQETIFDDGRSCLVFESLQMLQDYVQSYISQGKPRESEETIRARNKFVGHEVHGGEAFGHAAKRCKDMILQDYYKYHQALS